MRLAARHHPDAIVVANGLPAGPLVALVHQLSAGGEARRIIVIGERATLAGDALGELLDLGVSACLAWEELPLEAVPRYLAAILDGRHMLLDRAFVAATRASDERRRGPRVDGLLLTPTERPAGRDDDGATPPDGRRFTLWADNPDLTASLLFLADRAGLATEIAKTAAALLAAAERARPGDILVIDCATAADALERCQAVVTNTTHPVYICHPEESFVDDLRTVATGELIWLSPESLGLSVLRKLRLIGGESGGAPAAEPAVAPSPSFSGREEEVLELSRTGLTNREIAFQLGISKHTVKSHRANARNRMGVRGRGDAGTSGAGDEEG